jgi:N-acetylneuraminic acid mutarotase
MRRIVFTLILSLITLSFVLTGCDEKTPPEPEEPTWHTLSDFPLGVYWGGAMVWDGANTIYALRGNAELDQGRDVYNETFWEYDIPTNEWTQLDDTFGSPGWSSSLAWAGGDEVFYLQGNGTDNFLKYSIALHDWTQLSEIPEPNVQWAGNSLVWPNSGDYLYALAGNGNTDFWRYNMLTNEWSGLASVPRPMGYGSSLTWGGDDWIFATAGATAGPTTLWRYDVSDNAWTQRAVPDTSTMNAGAWLTFDGDGTIYAILGGGSSEVWTYDVDGNDWAQLEDAPDILDPGSAIVSDGDAVYTRQGGGASGFWKYE